MRIATANCANDASTSAAATSRRWAARRTDELIVGVGAHALFALLALQRLHDVHVGATLVRLVVLRVLEQHLVHVGARVLEQPIRRVENDQRNFAIAQHRQLIGLLHQTEFALRERDLRKERIIYM